MQIDFTFPYSLFLSIFSFVHVFCLQVQFHCKYTFSHFVLDSSYHSYVSLLSDSESDDTEDVQAAIHHSFRETG